MLEFDQVDTYFRAAMRKHELEQARMNAGRSAIHHLKMMIYMPDIKVESVEYRPSRSHYYGRDHGEQGNKRVLQVATQGWQIAVGSPTTEFGCLPWPS